MNERNEKMAAMLVADVPARDLPFEIALLAKIERRRFRRGLAANGMLALVACLVLALAMPVLQPVWDAGLAESSRMLPRFTNLGLGIVLMTATLALQAGFPLTRE